jgi:hypothetical protein
MVISFVKIAFQKGNSILDKNAKLNVYTKCSPQNELVNNSEQKDLGPLKIRFVPHHYF